MFFLFDSSVIYASLEFHSRLLSCSGSGEKCYISSLQIQMSAVTKQLEQMKEGLADMVKAEDLAPPG